MVRAEFHIERSGTAGGARRSPGSADVTSRFPQIPIGKTSLPWRLCCEPGRTIGHREQPRGFFFFFFFGVLNSASVDFSAYLTDESALGGGVVTANVTLFQHGPVLLWGF